MRSKRQMNNQDGNQGGGYESDIPSMAVWNNELYISASDNSGTWALFKSNGNVGNATRLVDIVTLRPTPVIFSVLHGPRDSTS